MNSQMKRTPIAKEFFAKTILRLEPGAMTREQLANMKANILDRALIDDPLLPELLLAIEKSSTRDSRIIFMGFCPNADFARRLDLDWKSRGVCEFHFDDSEHQDRNFATIRKGELLVLKKNHVLGKSVQLYGHGRVVDICFDEEQRRYLKVDWSLDDSIIEVQLTGCTATVNIMTRSKVEAKCGADFYKWLGKDWSN